MMANRVCAFGSSGDQSGGRKEEDLARLRAAGVGNLAPQPTPFLAQPRRRPTTWTRGKGRRGSTVDGNEVEGARTSATTEKKKETHSTINDDGKIS